MSLLSRTSALATLSLGALLALGACSDAATAPEMTARMAAAPVSPVLPIAYSYAVELSPCTKVLINAVPSCPNASVTGTASVSPANLSTPPNVKLVTNMWWATTAGAGPLPPAGAVAVAGPAGGGPATVQIPAAVGKSSKTVAWAERNALVRNEIPIPAGMTHVCLKGEIFVNGVSRALQFACTKL